MSDEDDVSPAHPASADACRALVDLAPARDGPENSTLVVAGQVVK